MHDSMDGNGGWLQGRLVAGRYRLDSLLGEGAMGVVWRAADLRLDRTVAVKLLRVPAGSTPEEIPKARQQVFREARIAARLKHPQAVAVYDVTTDGHHQPILIMEYVASQSLADLLDRSVLPVEQVARIGAETASALTAAHAAGIVHRDIKPANILLPDHGENARGNGSGSHETIKITDFGLASIIGEGGNSRGRVTGTPAFLAPETARGEPHTPASDVFSLGATLYAALEGDPPFGSVEDPATQLQRVAYGQPRPPRHAGALTRPLQAMLHDDPKFRPTMSQVAQALTAVAQNSETGMSSGPDPRLLPATEGTARSTRRRRAAVAVFVGLALAVLGLLATTSLTSVTDDNAGSAADPVGPPSTPSTTPATPTPPAIDSAVLEQVVTNYYTLLEEDPGRAWYLLGPALREQDRKQFARVWSEVEDIRVREDPRVSGNAVVVEIEYTIASGDRVRETHQHTMLTQDGAVLINSDYVVSSQVIKRDGREQRGADDGDHADDYPTDDATPVPPPPGSSPQPYDPSNDNGRGEPGTGGPGPGGPKGGGPKGISTGKTKGDSLVFET